jgi:hypothetical protein
MGQWLSSRQKASYCSHQRNPAEFGGDIALHRQYCQLKVFSMALKLRESQEAFAYSPWEA